MHISAVRQECYGTIVERCRTNGEHTKVNEQLSENCLGHTYQERTASNGQQGSTNYGVDS